MMLVDFLGVSNLTLFLCKIRELRKREELLEHYFFQVALTVGLDVDIGEPPPCAELISIQSFVKKIKNTMPPNILKLTQNST